MNVWLYLINVSWQRFPNHRVPDRTGPWAFWYRGAQRDWTKIFIDHQSLTFLLWKPGVNRPSRSRDTVVTKWTFLQLRRPKENYGADWTYSFFSFYFNAKSACDAEKVGVCRMVWLRTSVLSNTNQAKTNNLQYLERESWLSSLKKTQKTLPSVFLMFIVHYHHVWAMLKLRW